MFRLLLLSTLFFAFSAQAEEKADAKAAEEKPATEAPAANADESKEAPAADAPKKEEAKPAGEATKVLIMDVEGVDVEETALKTTTELIAGAFDGRTDVNGVTMSSLKDLASWASAQEAMSCKDKLACLSELSKYAEAPAVLKSDLGKVGTQWVLTLVHFDVKTASAKNRLSQSFGTISEMQQNAKDMVAKVMGWKEQVATNFKLGDGEKISLAVFNLKTAGVSENIAANLTQVLSAALKEVEGTTVISNDDIQAMMQLEGEKQNLGCTDDMSCLSEIGGALGVDNLVVGHVGKVQDSFVISLRLINPNEAKVDNRLVESFKGQEATLLAAIKFAGWGLLGFKPTQEGSLVVTASEPKSKLYVDGKEVGTLPQPPIEKMKPGRHAIRIEKPRFWSWEGEVYVKPADLTSQWIELEKKPVRFIELPKNVWLGLAVLSAASLLPAGVYYGLNLEQVNIHNLEVARATSAKAEGLTDGTELADGAIITETRALSSSYQNSALTFASIGLGLGLLTGGLTPFVVWEE